jgi:hypothetical protein
VPEIKKAGEAARAAGLNVQNGQATASVLDAHRFRSALGDRINWNPAVVMEANDELKDLYFKVGDEIDNTVGPGIRPFNKRCQEALLSQKALKYQLGLQLAGQSMTLSAAQRAAIKAGKISAAVGIGTEAYRRLFP